MSQEIAVDKFTTDELSTEKLSELIANRKSFKVVAVKDMSYTINKVEGAIEKKGLRCRVYTEYRSSAMSGMIIPTGATQVVGLFSAIGIAAHNLVTLNPDYEIAKNLVNSSLTISYKKE